MSFFFYTTYINVHRIFHMFSNPNLFVSLFKGEKEIDSDQEYSPTSLKKESPKSPLPFKRYTATELEDLLRDKLDTLNRIPNMDSTNIEKEITDLKDKEIVADIFNNTATLVANVYPKSESNMNRTSKKPIIISTTCPMNPGQFAKALIRCLKLLVEGLPDKSLRNITKRFFSRAERVTKKDLELSIKKKFKLKEVIQDIEHSEAGQRMLNNFTDEIEYAKNYNLYCTCYAILKYFIENQKAIDVGSRLVIVVLVTKLLQYFKLKNQREGFVNVLYNELGMLLRSYIHNLPGLPQENSRTYQDIQRLMRTEFGQGKSRAKTPRKRYVTKHTTRKGKTRKTGKKK